MLRRFGPAAAERMVEFDDAQKLVAQRLGELQFGGKRLSDFAGVGSIAARQNQP